MFEWLTDFIDDARIALAYPAYERQCRDEWVKSAERTYSTAGLVRDIRLRMAEPLHHCRDTFDTPLGTLDRAQARVVRVVAEAEEKLAILRRDYRSELDRAYRTLNEASAELDACRNRLAAAHADLKEAKRTLDAWYARAERNWFGNAGEKLPRHAFFGQDLSDRDRYKSRRDDAAREVARHKAERATIGRRLEEARAAVRDIRTARQQMFDLRKEGYDERLVTSAIAHGKEELHALCAEIERLRLARSAYLDQANAERGIPELELKIQRMQQDREARVRAFDDVANVDERKAKHRAAWLTAHGRSSS